MSRQSPFVIELSGADRARLEAVACRRTAQRRQVLRTIVFGAAEGEGNVAMAERLGVALNTVIKWRKRFFEEGMEGEGYLSVVERRSSAVTPPSYWSAPGRRYASPMT